MMVLDFFDTLPCFLQGWTYKMKASFLEIYNEDIRDLLASEKGLKYEIKRIDTKTNDVYVTNLKVASFSISESFRRLSEPD